MKTIFAISAACLLAACAVPPDGQDFNSFREDCIAASDTALDAAKVMMTGAPNWKVWDAMKPALDAKPERTSHLHYAAVRFTLELRHDPLYTRNKTFLNCLAGDFNQATHSPNRIKRSPAP
ncbi:hypothetical protein FHI69_03125 [Janthinobacterium lividum]|uniref:Lipoprotein n=1 Tax=Janthinobacterium lividum TaxID=29581 RepID=A0A5C4P133_9BURK|nr:hypothetical protein [Janthinobacterium lividum]TNC78299.1 hypothetical protein FHI69_03125 [Janthinobacterium lividum]